MWIREEGEVLDRVYLRFTSEVSGKGTKNYESGERREKPNKKPAGERCSGGFLLSACFPRFYYRATKIQYSSLLWTTTGFFEMSNTLIASNVVGVV